MAAQHPNTPLPAPGDKPAGSGGSSMEAKFHTVPIEVFIVTRDYEVRGVVHVPRGARADRRLTELLNSPGKKFLAVTDVELLLRGDRPSTPQHYDFIELHVDSIQLLHPSAQSLIRTQPMADWQHRKLDQLRNRLIMDS